jgi:hypothetical protein
MLNSLATFGLLKSAFDGDLFASAIKPITDKWLKDIHQLCGDLRSNRITQPVWQQKIEELFARIELSEVLRFTDIEQLEKQIKIPEYGLSVAPIKFPKMDWLPEERGWGIQIFALDKGCAIIPHGHHNMVSMHMILKGKMHVRHYDRVKEEPNSVLIRPTIDKMSTIGDATTISDDKDNIHWLKNIGGDKAFTLDVVVAGLNPSLDYSFKQYYVDPLGGQKTGDGLIRARQIDYTEAERLYRRS